MRETILSAISNTCSPVVQDANSDDSKIQSSSCFLILASLLTKHGADNSSMLGCPFSTAAAYFITISPTGDSLCLGTEQNQAGAGLQVGPPFMTQCEILLLTVRDI